MSCGEGIITIFYCGGTNFGISMLPIWHISTQCNRVQLKKEMLLTAVNKHS